MRRSRFPPRAGGSGGLPYAHCVEATSFRGTSLGRLWHLTLGAGCRTVNGPVPSRHSRCWVQGTICPSSLQDSLFQRYVIHRLPMSAVVRLAHGLADMSEEGTFARRLCGVAQQKERPPRFTGRHWRQGLWTHTPARAYRSSRTHAAHRVRGRKSGGDLGGRCPWGCRPGEAFCATQMVFARRQITREVNA